MKEVEGGGRGWRFVRQRGVGQRKEARKLVLLPRTSFAGKCWWWAKSPVSTLGIHYYGVPPTT